MESEDPKVLEFLESVFHDMKMRHTSSGVVNLSSPDRARARPYAKFKKQLNVMYRALNPMLISGFEKLFLFLTLNESNAFSLMSAHCFAVWEQCTEGIDVFLHLMYTCSFTYSLLAFCESKGEHNLLHLFTKWIIKMYSDPIEPKFEDADGWEGLDEFCSAPNLHLILDFINLCYNNQGKLFTHIVLGESLYFFGLNHDDTITSLKDNFNDFKNSVFTEFESEINRNLKYKFGVMLAFIKIELAFDHTASVFNPPSPRRRLLYPTPVLFLYYMWDSLKNKMPDTIRRAFIEQEEQALANQEQAFVNQERAPLNQERAPLNQERAPLNQERAPFNQERAAFNQERATFNQTRAPNQTRAHANQERARANQKPAHSNQESAHANQEPARANQEPAHANQEPAHAKKKRARAKQEQAHSNQEDLTIKKQTHFDVENDGSCVEQAPTTSLEIIAILRQCIDILNPTQPVKEHFLSGLEARDFGEQASDVEKQGPHIIKQISAAVKQYFSRAKQSSGTVEQEFHNIEKALAAVELAPGAKRASDDVEQASDIEERASDIEERASDIEKQGSRTIKQIAAIVKQYFARAKQSSGTIEQASRDKNRTRRRLVLVKNAPNYDESDSDTE